MNRNVLGLVVSSISIPQIITHSATNLTHEENKSITSKLLWSLAGLFIAVFICCCGFGVVGLKQMADAKADQMNGNDEAVIQTRVQSTLTADVHVENSASLAETVVPLVSIYNDFNQDESLSTPTPRNDDRLTFVSAGSSLSTGAEQN